MAYVLSLSDTGSGPSSAAAPAPTPSPTPTPPAPQISLLVTLSTRSGSRTLAPPALSPTEVVLVDGDPDQPDVASIHLLDLLTALHPNAQLATPQCAKQRRR